MSAGPVGDGFKPVDFKCRGLIHLGVCFPVLETINLIKFLRNFEVWFHVRW